MGSCVGELVGMFVGVPVGVNVGNSVGWCVGLGVGGFVGDGVGEGVGVTVGEGVGGSVGVLVGAAVGVPVRKVKCLIWPSSQTGNPDCESSGVHETPSLLPEKFQATGDQLLLQPFSRSILYWATVTGVSKVYCSHPDGCCGAEQ